MAYRRGPSTVLGLQIPLEAATNAAEVGSYQEREQKRQKLKEEGGAEAAKVGGAGGGAAGRRGGAAGRLCRLLKL